MLTKTSVSLAPERMSCEVKADTNIARRYSLGRTDMRIKAAVL
jgi:hypothetical protein